MTVTSQQLLLYALGMAGLWAVPGPVWVALIARALSGGMRGAWPLAVGVALGDLIWPLCAILGLALFLDRARQLLSSPQALRRMNIGSGLLLILVGLVIPFT